MAVVLLAAAACANAIFLFRFLESLRLLEADLFAELALSVASASLAWRAVGWSVVEVIVLDGPT